MCHLKETGQIVDGKILIVEKGKWCSFERFIRAPLSYSSHQPLTYLQNSFWILSIILISNIGFSRSSAVCFIYLFHLANVLAFFPPVFFFPWPFVFVSASPIHWHLWTLEMVSQTTTWWNVFFPSPAVTKKFFVFFLFRSQVMSQENCVKVQ